MFRVLFAAFLGGTIFFAWNVISWLALPWHQETIKQFSDEGFISQSLNSNTTEAGIYILPKLDHSYATNFNAIKSRLFDVEKKATHRGTAFISIQAFDSVRSLKTTTIYALIASILINLLVVVLVLCTNDLSYSSRLTFIMIVGLVGSLFAYLPLWILWGFDSHYVVINIIDSVFAWFLAGLAIAALIGREPPSYYDRID